LAGTESPAAIVLPLARIDAQRDAEYYEGAVIACEFAKRSTLQSKAYEQQNQ
jgi:hypothetical protein